MEGKASVALLIACELVGSKLERNAGPIRGTTSVGGFAVPAEATSCAVQAARSPVKATLRIVGVGGFVRYQLDQRRMMESIVNGCELSVSNTVPTLHLDICFFLVDSPMCQMKADHVNDSPAPPCWRS